MSRKGFASIIILLLLASVLVVGGAWYYKARKVTETVVPQEQYSSTTIPTSPAKLDVGAPAPPADQALSEVTILSEENGAWKIYIDKIRDYIRYPAATNSQLKVGDTVSIRFDGWLDTYQSSDKVCSAGYIKSPKPAQAGSATQSSSTRPQPQITVGQKYLSKLLGCFAQANCQTIGWSGWFYNSTPIVIEYDCVRSSTNTPPTVGPQR